MSLLFCDSFDHYNTLSQKYSNVTGTVSVSSTAARSGAAGLLVNVNGSGQQNFSSRATYIVGFAHNMRSFNTPPAVLVSLQDSGSVQIRLQMDVAGVLTVLRGASAIASATLLVSLTAWHYIEIKATIDPSAGVVVVNVDGIQYISFSGNTRSTTNSSVNQVVFGEPAGTNVVYWMDDIYICDNAGSVNNDFLGDLVVKALLPTGNGTQNNFAIGGTAPAATNWQSVNENPPDDNTTYVKDGVAGDIDRYTYGALGITGNVKAVVVNLRAEKDDAGTRTIRAATKSGLTVGDNGSDFTLSFSSYADFQGIFETDPNTPGTAWTVTNVNAAEFGVKVTS